MLKKLIVILILGFPLSLWAQTTVSGIVYDYDNKTFPLQDVHVQNLNNNQSTKTKASGGFKITAKAGDLLVFSLSHYHTDTMYLIDLKLKKVYLPVDATDLKEVEILGAKVNPLVYYKDPEAREFKRIDRDDLRGKGNNDRAGGLVFNLGYDKYKNKDKKLRAMEETEGYEAEIRSIFTESYVSKLTKLKDDDLKNFMLLYRPSVLLVSADRPFNYDYYIVKAYHTWLKLPQDQRKVAPLPKLKSNY
ncbi:hypothetical protein [Pedobacter metabolipauper]|uniref:Carboxypeptidase-like protein n=1 Tax=Pedobacter metabolipauper TaxID=425513 RepID=A0A4V3D0V4_9SPHI|nr:hypothetical protein [Pedobacter metabolipauper]TDQ07619.1 hypothetical protein ATK78_3746 [Pedobacter metabolipauper]